MPRRWRGGAEYREMVVLAVPLLVGQLGQVVLSFADSAMVGNYGVADLAASSFCVNLFNLPLIFLMGYSYGVLPALGRAFRDLGGMRSVVAAGVRNMLWVSGCVMLVMGVPLLFLEAFHQPAALHERIVSYYLLMLVSLLAVGLFNVLKQFFDVRGKTWIAMTVLVGANGLNILGNWLLIFGKLGFPEWGLFGAGVSTLVARVLEAGILGVLYLRWRSLHRPPKPFPTYLGRWELLRNGSGMGMQLGLETAMFSLSVIFVGWLGNEALAAHHIAVTVQTLGFMTYYGLGGAVSIRVSRAIGQRQPKRARLTAAVGLRLMWGCAAVIAALMGYFRESIAALFTTEPAVGVLAGTLLLVGIAYQPADALQVCYSNALRGVGDARGLALIAFVAYFLLGLPLAFLLSTHFTLGALGVWLGYPIGLLGAGLAYAWRFYRVLRKG